MIKNTVKKKQKHCTIFLQFIMFSFFNMFYNVKHSCDAKLNFQLHYSSLQCRKVLSGIKKIKYNKKNIYIANAMLYHWATGTLSIHIILIVEGCTEEKSNQHQGRQFLSDALLFLIFSPDIYIGSKYRLSVYLVCNNWYRHLPWKTHIGRPLIYIYIYVYVLSNIYPLINRKFKITAFI